MPRSIRTVTARLRASFGGIATAPRGGAMSISSALLICAFAAITAAGCAASVDHDPGASDSAAAALSGTTLFSEPFASIGSTRWPFRSSAFTTTSTLASASSYPTLQTAAFTPSGAPVARVRSCSGTCTLQSQAIDLGSASAVSLELSVSTTFSDSSDSAGLRVLGSNGTWQDFGTAFTRDNSTAAWRRVEIDLSAFRGRRDFRFALYGRSLEPATSTRPADMAQFDDVRVIAAYASACGDGVRTGAEQCDGADLGGNTCVGLGFNGGTLGCSPGCTLDTAQCSDQTGGGIDCRNPSTWPAAWTQLEGEVLTLTNQRRVAGASCGGTAYPAVPALVSNDKLRQAARCHSLDMAIEDYFSHTGLDGSNPGNRIAAAGYVYRTWGENIAAGYRTAQQVVDGWMTSPGHCVNIMRSSFVHLGVGYAFDSASGYDHYWTQDFGAGN